MLSKQKWIAIDWGTKWLGVASAPVDGAMVFARDPISVDKKSERQVLEALALSLEGEEIHAFVVGLPLSMTKEGAEVSSSLKKVRRFILGLERYFQKPVHLTDERLSSEQARVNLRGVSQTKVKTKVHSEAAAVILEEFLRCSKKS